MRDQFTHRQSPRKYQPRGFFLPIHSGAVTAQNFFFFHADGRSGKFDPHLRVILREQKNAPARSGEVEARRLALREWARRPARRIRRRAPRCAN